MRTIDPLAVLCLLLLYTFETASGRPTDPSDTGHVVDSSIGQSKCGFWTSDNGAGSIGRDSGSMADPPRLPTPPAATVSEGGGWLARWLSMGGEGLKDARDGEGHGWEELRWECCRPVRQGEVVLAQLESACRCGT